MKKLIELIVIIGLIQVYVIYAQEPLSDLWTSPTPIPDNGGSATGNVGNNMVITSTGEIVLVYNETLPGGQIRMYQTTTSNDGQSWTPPVDFPADDGLIGTTGITMAIDTNDVIHAVFGARGPIEGVYYTQSTDGGNTWSPALRISDSVRYHINYKFITTDRNGRLHVFWHDGDETVDSLTAEVWYTRSPDGGITWETPMMLSSDDGYHSAFPRADFSATFSDTLLVAWRDSRAPGDDWDIYGAVSYDGGINWTEQLIAGGTQGRQWDPMVLIDKHGMIHLGVMEYPAGHQIDVFVWYSHSSDGGTTWSAPQTIRAARTIFPVFTYDAIRDILWYFLRIESPPGPDATSDLGVRYSTDQGVTWSNVERLTQLSTGGTKYPAFATGQDGIVRVTYSLKDSSNNDKLFFQKRREVPGEDVETFFVVHCEPQTPYLWPKLIQLVQLANNYNVPLTIQLTPQWVEMILTDSLKIQRVRQWQQEGHEIAAHHHGVYHLNWDQYTNYPDSVILEQGWSLDDLLGNMDDYRAVLEAISGDSLMLTMGGPGASDPDSSVDWQPDFLYRTGGGRHPARAFSSPRVVGMGQYYACQVDYYFLKNQGSVDSLITEYNNRSEKDVVGATTHVFNFAPDSSYLVNWFQFIQTTSRKTVRQIMRDHHCHPDSNITSIVRTPSALPGTFSLMQNYPNPFNPGTTIEVVLSQPAHIQLRVYDILGREVTTLLESQLTAGTHRVTWDGTNDAGQKVPSGVYFYRLKVGTRWVQTRKMMLLR